MKRSTPRTFPQHGAVWAKDLVDDLRSEGFSVAQIIGNTGITLKAIDHPESKLSFDQLALLFERVAELKGDDLLGFHRGQCREMRRSGMFAYIGLSSPTVATFIHNQCRYRRIFSDAVEYDPARLDAEGIIAWHFNVPASIDRRQYIEFGASGTVHDLRDLTGRRALLDLVEFRHHRRRNIAELERFFGCPVLCGADENRLHLKPSQLDAPLRTADSYLHRMVRECCEEALAKKASSAPPLTVAVEREIAVRLSAGGPTQSAVAKAVGMSTRTLSRRLSDENTTFFRVLEGYREAMAKSLITRTDLQMTEVAFLLGYADLSSFSTAFRRWSGKTPSEFRTLR